MLLPGYGQDPGFGVVLDLSTLAQRFVCTHLSYAHMT